MSEVKNAKAKKILETVGNVLIWVFVAFSIVVTAMVFAAQGSEDGIPELFGVSLITIETPSMTPALKKGDLAFMEKLSDEQKSELKAGDIITYRAPIDINGDGQIGDLNTHRIEEIDPETGKITTKGDNNPAVDTYTITKNDIIGKCDESKKLGGVGNVIGFLREPLGFFLCVVLPLILFFIYELYNFITVLVSQRAAKKPLDKETEEEIKRKAVEEYLKQQKETEGKEETEQQQTEEK